MAQRDSAEFSAVRHSRSVGMSITCQTCRSQPINVQSQLIHASNHERPSLFCEEVSLRFWVAAGSGARFCLAHGIRSAVGSLSSLRLQPVRHAFATGLPRRVTRTFVPPLETPAACRGRSAITTLQPCENFAEYRIRLLLPYILRGTPLRGATVKKHARCQSGSYEKQPMARGQVI